MAPLGEPVGAETTAQRGLMGQVVEDDDYDVTVAGVTARPPARRSLGHAWIKQAIGEAA